MTYLRADSRKIDSITLGSAGEVKFGTGLSTIVVEVGCSVFCLLDLDLVG